MRKKLSKVPVTILGVILGVSVGVIGAIKGVLEKKFPTIGIIITVATPVVTFFIENILKTYLPDAYRKRIAGSILYWFRWLFNESFSVRFTYSLRFPDGHKTDVDGLCRLLGAAPGQDPQPVVRGNNYLHLQYANVRNFIAINWYDEEAQNDAEAGSEDTNQIKRAIIVTLHPSVQTMVMREAPDILAFLANRLNGIRTKLILGIGNQTGQKEPDEQAISEAWLGSREPPKRPQLIDDTDKSTNSRVMGGPGWIQLVGSDPSVLPAIFRWVKILEPGPDDDQQ